MCCRISTTGFAARTIAGLYILLATFLIGFVVTQVVSWSDRYLLDTTFEDVSVSPLIEYNCSYYGAWSVALFRVKNLGSQPVTFERDSRTGDIPTVLTDKIRSLTGNVQSQLNERQVPPGETAVLWVPIPKIDVEISFRYGVGGLLQTSSVFLPAGSQRTCNYPD
jgi:hypothetical protein